MSEKQNWVLQSIKVGVKQGLVDVAQPTRWMTNRMRRFFLSSKKDGTTPVEPISLRSPDFIPAYDLAEGFLANVVGIVTAFACVCLAAGFTIVVAMRANQVDKLAVEGSPLMPLVQATTFLVTMLVAFGWLNQALQTYRRIDQRDECDS